MNNLRKMWKKQGEKRIKVIFDTNVIISAIVFDKTPLDVLLKSIELRKQGKLEIFMCRWILKELRDVFKKHFPSNMESFEQFLNVFNAEIFDEEDKNAHVEISDPYDEPIVRCEFNFSI